MGSNDYNVIFPDEILEGMNIEAFTIAPRDHRIGVAILSGKHENMYVLRLYQVIKREDQQFYPTHELEAFSFYSKKPKRIYRKATYPNSH